METNQKCHTEGGEFIQLFSTSSGKQTTKEPLIFFGDLWTFATQLCLGVFCTCHT